MDSLEKILSERRTRCVWLRTKAMYLNLPDPGTPEMDLSTACWWCLRTADAFGPDGHAADPATCGSAGRSCHEGPPVL
jgi:hypothetical protein